MCVKVCAVDPTYHPFHLLPTLFIFCLHTLPHTLPPYLLPVSERSCRGLTQQRLETAF